MPRNAPVNCIYAIAHCISLGVFDRDGDGLVDFKELLVTLRYFDSLVCFYFSIVYIYSVISVWELTEHQRKKLLVSISF